MSDDENDAQENLEEVMIDDSLLVTNMTAASFGANSDQNNQPSTSSKNQPQTDQSFSGISNMELTLQYLSGKKCCIFV